MYWLSPDAQSNESPATLDRDRWSTSPARAASEEGWSVANQADAPEHQGPEVPVPFLCLMDTEPDGSCSVR